MARGQIRRTRHGQGRGGEHGFNRYASAELRQRLVKDLARRGFLDKLYQGFDRISKLHTCKHCPTLPLVPGSNPRLDYQALDHMFPLLHDTCPTAGPSRCFEKPADMTLHRGAHLDNHIFMPPCSPLCIDAYGRIGAKLLVEGEPWKSTS